MAKARNDVCVCVDRERKVNRIERERGFRNYLPNTFFIVMKKSSTFLCEMDYSIFKLSFFTCSIVNKITLSHCLSSSECLWKSKKVLSTINELRSMINAFSFYSPFFLIITFSSHCSLDICVWPEDMNRQINVVQLFSSSSSRSDKKVTSDPMHQRILFGLPDKSIKR